MDNTDLIIYVSADCTGEPSGVLAFASACELESVLDRLVHDNIICCSCTNLYTLTCNTL